MASAGSERSSGSRAAASSSCSKGSDYGPFVRDLVRTREEELVLIGTAALYSVQTLWHVVTARSAGLLPTGGSQVYNAEAPGRGRRAGV